MSSIIDYTDRATCVIFGDGAGAVILEEAEDDSVGLIDLFYEVDGSGACYLYMPGADRIRHPAIPSTRTTMFIRMASRFSSSQCASKPRRARNCWSVMA